MVTINQVQKGFTTFVDRYVAAAYSGAEKVVLLTATTLLAARLPKLANSYIDHPVVKALGLYEPESGHIDIDAVYNAIAGNIGEEKIPITIPKFFKIDLGTIKLGKEDLTALVRCIKEA